MDNVDYGHDHPGENLFGQVSDPAYYVRQDVDKGKWHEWIIHMKLASEAGASDGVVEMWKNGLKEMEYLHLNNYTPGSNYFSEGYIQGYANSGFAEDTNIYIDDFVVSTSPIVHQSASPPASPRNLTTAP